MHKAIKLLKTHSLRELFLHALLQLRMQLMRLSSTAIFWIKCHILGIACGRGAKIWGRIFIARFPGSEISIGKNVRVVSHPDRYAFNIFPQSKIRTYSPSAKVIIGDDVGFNSISIFARSQVIRIGDKTMIGGNCQIMDSDGHPLWPPDGRWHYSGTEHDRPVMIGSNVFIGLNVIILKGAQIGDNCVIGAGSVVSGQIPACTLASGMPARVLRRLDEDSARGAG